MRHALVCHSGYSTAAFQRASWEIRPAFQWKLLRVGDFNFASLDLSKRPACRCEFVWSMPSHATFHSFLDRLERNSYLLNLCNYCPLLGCMHILFSTPRFSPVWQLFLLLLKTPYGWCQVWVFELSVSIVRLARSLEAEIRLLLCRITARSQLSRKSCWINLDGFNRYE